MPMYTVLPDSKLGQPDVATTPSVDTCGTRESESYGRRDGIYPVQGDAYM